MATTFSTLRQMVGRLLGAGDMAMITGTPSGGYSTTAFQCSTLDQFENDYFNEWNLRIYSGTHKDLTRTITDFAKTNGVVTFSPAVTGNIDATDLFELHRDYTPEEIMAAINLAIMMVETEALIDKVDESLVVNDLLVDGLFEVWTNTSTLTNWTKGGTGTLAQESTIKREGSYSAKLTNTAASACWLYQSIGNYPRYAGEDAIKASLYARVCCFTAARVRLALTDGVNTWYSDYHDGHGWREGESEPWLKIENQTISNAATALTAQFRIETGGAIDAYVDKMYLICGEGIYEYTLPTGFYTIDGVYQEQAVIGRFSYKTSLIPQDKGWRLLKNNTVKKLWIDPSVVSLTTGRRLRLEGQAIATQLTLDADTTTITPAYLVQQAAALLHQSRIDGRGSVAEQHDIQSRLCMALADRERRKLAVAPRGQRV